MTIRISTPLFGLQHGKKFRLGLIRRKNANVFRLNREKKIVRLGIRLDYVIDLVRLHIKSD